MSWDFTLLASFGKPINEFYDPKKERDGGGYWQYKGFCTYAIYEKRSISSPYVEHLMTFCIEDSSCGWFGTRRHANIGAEQGGEWNFSWGSMDGFGNESRDKALAEISAATGIDEPALLEILKQSFDTVSKRAKEKWNETHPNPAKGGWLD